MCALCASIHLAEDVLSHLVKARPREGHGSSLSLSLSLSLSNTHTHTHTHTHTYSLSLSLSLSLSVIDRLTDKRDKCKFMMYVCARVLGGWFWGNRRGRGVVFLTSVSLLWHAVALLYACVRDCLMGFLPVNSLVALCSSPYGRRLKDPI